MMRLRIVVRFEAPRTVASRFLAYSLATHILLLVTLVLLPSLRSTRAMSDTPLLVDLVSFPSPTPVSAPVSVPAPPPTEPVAQPEGVRVETTAPEPVADDPPPVEKPKREPEPDKPERTVETPPSPSANPAPGEPSGPPGDAGATITAMEGVGDFELGWYKSSVTAALFGRWRKPILEGIGEPREVRVTFQIQRDGRVTDLQVEAASGVPSLDRSALRAVADAAPLPPLPPNWREPTLSAGFVFRLYPE